MTDWSPVAGLIRDIAPTLGGLIGSIAGPAGAAIGTATGRAVGTLAEALGLPPGAGPAEVEAAIKADPDAAAKIAVAEGDFRAEIARAMAAQASEIGQTQRAEIAAGVSWWHWRHLIGYATGLCLLAIVAPACWHMVRADASAILAIVPLLGALAPIYLAAAGLNGYIASDTSRRTLAAHGIETPTIAGAIAGAIKGRR